MERYAGEMNRLAKLSPTPGAGGDSIKLPEDYDGDRIGSPFKWIAELLLANDVCLCDRNKCKRSRAISRARVQLGQQSVRWSLEDAFFAKEIAVLPHLTAHWSRY